MKSLYTSTLLVLVVAACTAPAGNDSDLQTKKKELEQTKKQLTELREKAKKLETEIKESDPSFGENNNAILVSTFVAEKKPFEHKVEIRGAVASRRNILIASQAMGEIERVYVREGQRVKKGQVLVTLNADVIRNSIKELKTSLDLANQVYEKQAKLWEQKIGTEIQYLKAKNDKESLERKLATVQAQLDQTISRAPFNGTIDELPARVGEMASPGTPLVRVVSPDEMYIKADVSERFIGRFKKGDPVNVYFPALNKSISSSILSVGQVINPENRTYTVEVALANIAFTVKPNQVTVLEMRDYVSDEAFAVPTRIIQRDEDGQFIFAIDDRGNNKFTAKKVYVTTGITAGTQTEILEGLNGSEQIVDRGFRDLTEGVDVEIEGSKKEGGLANK